MEKCVNIVFIGGDDRAAFASAYLCQMGYEVGYCSCKSQKFSSAVKIENVCDAVEFADVIVLPIPVTRDSQSVSYSDGALLSLILNDISKDKKMLVLGGMIAVDVILDFSFITVIQWFVRMLPILSAIIMGNDSGFCDIAVTETNFKKDQTSIIHLFFEHNKIKSIEEPPEEEPLIEATEDTTIE